MTKVSYVGDIGLAVLEMAANWNHGVPDILGLGFTPFDSPPEGKNGKNKVEHEDKDGKHTYLQIEGSNLTAKTSDFGANWNFDGQLKKLTVAFEGETGVMVWEFSPSTDLGDLLAAAKAYVDSGHTDLSSFNAILDLQAFNYTGGAFDDGFSGFALADTVAGGAGNDKLGGNGGNDTIDGGAGNDTMDGGAGNDTFVYDGKGADTIEDFAGGAGAGDIIKVTAKYASFGQIKLHTTVGADTVIDFGDGNQLTLKGFAGALSADDFTFALPPSKASAGGDDLFGGAGNDTIDGLAGDDHIFGLDGDDKLTGGIGNDQIDGGDGNDTVSYAASKEGVTVNLTLQDPDVTLASKQEGGDADGDQLSGIENVIGSAHDDIIIATDGVINGGAGNDIIADGAGKDVLNGGTGDDLIINITPDSVADDLIGGAGNDTVSYASTGKAGENITLSLAQQFTEKSGGIGSGGAAVTGTNKAATGDRLSGFENIIGGLGDDTLTGDGKNNVIEGETGADTLEGGVGSDTLSYSRDLTGVAVTLNEGSAAAAVSNGHAAGDVATGFENILGGGGKDILEGNSAANIIDGGDNKDLLRGHDGNDTLRGGDGDDDLFGGAGADVMDGGASNGDALHYDLLTENITLTLGSKGAQTVVSSNSAKSEAKGDKIANFEQVVTGDGNDSITGSDGDDLIFAGDGNDLVQGLGGADNLSGEGGTDTLTYEKSAKGVTVDLNGGFGEDGDADGDLVSGFEILTGSKFNDALRADADTQKIDGGLGDDIVQSSVNAQVLIGGMGINTLSYAGDIKGVTVALVTGKAADLSGNAGGNHAEGDTATGFVNLIGGSGIDKLTGDSGNNVIEGGAGADILAGGNGGIDTLSYASSTSGVAVTIGGTAVGGDATGDVITWTGFRNLIGGTQGDTLKGDANANTISGLGGNDDIQGDDGNDILNGGAGDDSIGGGAKDDKIDGGDGDDFDLQGGAGNDTILGGAGNDNLGDADDEEGNDTLDGGAGNDVLAGGDGNDKLTGGSGDDEIYGFGGADTMDGGDGIDTLEYGVPSGPGFLTIDLQANTITVSGEDPSVIAEAKGDKIKNFENIEADNSNDTLRGTAGVNVIEGGGGNDLIEGRAGADTLDGQDNGSTGDTVSYEGSALGVTVNLNQAIQVSQGDADGDKLDNFENILGSAKDDVLTGDTGGNTIAGGKGNDVIQGNHGSDTLDGGVGVDTLDYSYSTDKTHTVTLGLANVVTTDSGDDGDDQDSVKNFENIVGGAKDDKFVGNSMANIISGGAGDDTIDGGAGNDTLDGGAGNDTLTTGGGIDTLSYLSATAGVAVDLTAESQDTIGAGFDTVVGVFTNLIGSDKDDIYLGGTNASNKIEGRGGDDTLFGGGGADTLDGGAGMDTVDYSGLGAGKSVTVTLAEAGKSATVSGSAVAEIGADKLIDVEGVLGGAGNDALTGNSAANLLDGGDGNDTLTGGLGIDELIGGGDNDFFRYTKAAEGGDTILDFAAGDKITIVKAGFGIAAGVKIGGAGANDFAAEYFVGNADPAATKAHGQFLFDSDAGGLSTLSWDADGTGGGAAVLIATFTNTAIITANDFDLK